MPAFHSIVFAGIIVPIIFLIELGVTMLLHMAVVRIRRGAAGLKEFRFRSYIQAFLALLLFRFALLPCTIAIESHCLD